MKAVYRVLFDNIKVSLRVKILWFHIAYVSSLRKFIFMSKFPFWHFLLQSLWPYNLFWLIQQIVQKKSHLGIFVNWLLLLNFTEFWVSPKTPSNLSSSTGLLLIAFIVKMVPFFHYLGINLKCDFSFAEEPSLKNYEYLLHSAF